jgi:hypothetical protein
MAANLAHEVRVELYADGDLPASLSAGITALLSQRWPLSWDVVIPPRPSINHPAEWRAVVPVPEGTTIESLHRQIAESTLGLDATLSLHLRTRWSFLEAPDEQEVYEVRWGQEST